MPGPPLFYEFEIFAPAACKEYDYGRKRLQSNLTSGIHTLISAARGFGVEHLVQNVCENITLERPLFRVVHVDLQGIHSSNDFANAITGALAGYLSGRMIDTHMEKDDPDSFLYLPEIAALKNKTRLICTVGNLQHLFRIDPT